MHKNTALISHIIRYKMQISDIVTKQTVQKKCIVTALTSHI